MLLPSDIARLVLGYLEQEGLRATSQAFLFESPHLKEYADHIRNNGAVSACVFSLFGKTLTSILTDYAVAKATETGPEPQVPHMMTSLWKKLDFTLNQIKSLQNSPAVSQDPRGSEDFGSRLEEESRISNRRNVLESKGTATPEALFTTAHMSFGPDPPSKIMISVDNVVICENQGGQQSYPASNQAVSRVIVSPLAQSLAETRPMERVANPETLVENVQAMSCLQGTEPLPAVKHTVLKGKEGQEPIRALVTDSEENGKLPVPSLSQVGKEMVSFGGCRKRTTVMNPALEVQWSEVTVQDTDKKLSVAAIQTLKSQVSCPEGLKTRPNQDQKHTRDADLGSKRRLVETLQSVAPMKDSTTARSPSGTSPQGHRRMLCLEVSSGDTASSAESPQRPSGATFRWISPPALENGRAEDSETTTERVKGVGTEEGLEKTPVDEILNGNMKCSRSRGKDRVGGVKGTMRLDSFSRKVQAVDGEGKIQCGGGMKKGDMQEVRSKVRDGSIGKTQGSRGWEARAETMSLPQPPFDTANKENELEGRSQARTMPPGPGESSSTHLPASLSPGCLQKTSSKTSALVRQVVDPLQDIQQQSPTPTLSKSPPHPRTPTLEIDRKATPSHLSRDPTAADTPTCSPAANMAAHTLMILSRATVAPLRDSSQQGAPQNSASNRKKHMQEELNASPAPSKELQLSANRTNAKRRKRLLDSFPDDLDVEKFLSSLHYDE
ncbi:hypothetical protein AGOR_G00123610 [Albula goreensis]|uniref:Protein NPAT C-terminal domain-containing protein n=1 Tax=Albula goreensis TaxID=1534307 RepID=A0A8T3DD31_9TELE|nr:hypothetical protein AGOR_G00123610 [Albula goreensis]